MAAPVSFMDAFTSAIIDGNIPLLKEAEMANGVDLRRLSGLKGQNLLLMAVAITCSTTGRLDFCRYLVEERGFDVNSTSDEGHDEAMELLLSRGIPVDPLNHHGTPLHLAAANGHAHALKILLDHGADPNKVVNHVYSPLLMACAPTPASLECIKLLVEAGADVNFQRSPGPTTLLTAVSVGSAEIVNFLLAAGADPNIHDGYGRFPIMQAAIRGRRELVEILLPRTNPIPSIPDWSVDGVIGTMKTLPRELFVEPIGNAKSEGKEAFANGDYGYAIYCFSRLREGQLAALEAKRCQRLRPRWAKAWFREGAAQSLLQLYSLAADAFEQALKLDPANEEIKKALSEARAAALSRELALGLNH